MGAKTKNLNQLSEKGINVHEFVELETFEDLIEYEKKNSLFSIRFDRYEDYKQLPFYVYERSSFPKEEEKLDFLKTIAKEAKEKNCTMLCSNGKRYEQYQVCNFVIKINIHQDFILEWCTENVALREMYQYTTSILKGNIKDDLKDMEWINPRKNKLDEKEIEKIILWAFSLNILDKSIESTLYSTKVGVLKQEIVCWQTV